MPAAMTRRRRRPATTTRRRRRTYRKPRMTRSVQSQVHRFCRSYESHLISGNAAHLPYQDPNGHFQFTSLPNYTEFSNLFDQYKVTFLSVSYFLEQDPSAQTAATSFYPKVYWVRNYDQVTTPLLSLNQMREHTRMRMRILTPTRPVTIKYKPNILSESYRTGSSTGFTPRYNQWIDMEATNQIHLGRSVCIDDLTNTNYKVRVLVKVWFACRGTQ